MSMRSPLRGTGEHPNTLCFTTQRSLNSIQIACIQSSVPHAMGHFGVHPDSLHYLKIITIELWGAGPSSLDQVYHLSENTEQGTGIVQFRCSSWTVLVP